jgi:hypothetical protein
MREGNMVLYLTNNNEREDGYLWIHVEFSLDTVALLFSPELGKNPLTTWTSM